MQFDVGFLAYGRNKMHALHDDDPVGRGDLPLLREKDHE
jgi:hypothetical protein